MLVPFSFLLIKNLLVCVMFRAALVGGVLLGLANPGLGCLADRYYLSKFSTFGIFIISGLSLSIIIFNVYIDGHLTINMFSFISLLIYFWVV